MSVMSSRTAFDNALELNELAREAKAYASRHGEPGSADYRAAWLRFRQKVQSVDDLQRLRAPSRRGKAQMGARR